jgi:Fur family transcriptional regulator, ferric uptake regulator
MPFADAVAMRHDPVVGDVEDVATAMLREVGQRVTRPRVLVLSQFIESGRAHVSADEVLEQVQANHAEIHRATVYRTLEGLTAAGVLRHVHLERGLTAYHLAVTEPGDSTAHLHAQCSHCGAVVDLPPHVLGDSAARIREATGFRLDATHVAFSGLCRDCART